MPLTQKQIDAAKPRRRGRKVYYGPADGEPPGLVFPEAGFRRRDAWSRLLGGRLPDALAPVGFLPRGGPC